MTTIKIEQSNSNYKKAVEQLYEQLGITFSFNEKNSSSTVVYGENVDPKTKVDNYKNLIKIGKFTNNSFLKEEFGITNLENINETRVVKIKFEKKLAKINPEIVLPGNYCKITVDEKKVKILAWIIDGNKKSPAIIEKNSQEKTFIFICFNIFNIAEEFLNLSLSNSRWLNKRDHLDRLNGKGSLLEKTGLIEKPVIDEIREILGLIHSYIEIKNGNYFVKKKLWPENKDFALFISHDIDTLVMPPLLLIRRNIIKFWNLWVPYTFGALKFFLGRGIDLTALFKEDDKKLENDPWFNTIKISEEEKEKQLKATFFFLDNDSIKDSSYPLNGAMAKSIIKKVKKNGGEIASHSEFKTSYNLESMKEQKEKFKKIEENVKGTRAHRIIFNSKSWNVASKSGFSYSSNSLFNDISGFRNGTSVPFRPLENNLIEIPVAVMDVSLALEQNKKFNIKKGQEKLKRLTKNIVQKNGILSLSWHPTSFENKKTTNNWETKFDHGLLMGKDLFWNTISYAKSLGNYWNATGSEITEWWIKRNKAKINIVQKNGTKKLKVESPFDLNGLTIQVKSKTTNKIFIIKNSCKKAVFDLN